MYQLNKLQIKAEILTILSKLQTSIDTGNVEELLRTLMNQNDKKAVLEILIKELTKSKEQRAVSICFLLLKLCKEQDLENSLWNVLKMPTVSDSAKAIILNLLKDMGNKIDYEKLEEYLDNPAEVIDEETRKLLHTAIINPEAQIDFLDFVNSLTGNDRKILVASLGEDYSSDALANILSPLVLCEPESELGKISMEILGKTKSQLALHNLLECLEFVDDEKTISLIKKNISKLKLSGIREDNTDEFYKKILSSKPYISYISYPDGHGNQAVIFSRKREDENENEAIQIIAIVINDSSGIIDCFGFNEISNQEFERIVNKFYNGDEHVCIDSAVLKRILENAEKLTRRSNRKISYEYICWKTLLIDIEKETAPLELILKNRIERKSLTDKDLEHIYMFDFLQRWFFDVNYNDEFKLLIHGLNTKIEINDFNFDLESIVKDNSEKIFTVEQKNLLDKRILMSAYLKYLSKDETSAQLLYSLYFDENKKSQLAENIIRKSIYEHYVMLKFTYNEKQKMTNIFTLKNKPEDVELKLKQIESAINIIEKLWVKN